MFRCIDICGGFVYALRQSIVNTVVFLHWCYKPCKYQRFGLQHAKHIANSSVLLKLLPQKARIKFSVA